MTFTDKAPIIRHGQKQPPPRERENTIGVLWVLMWARLGRENRIMKERENTLSITKRENEEINSNLERKRLTVVKSVSLSLLLLSRSGCYFFFFVLVFDSFIEQLLCVVEFILKCEEKWKKVTRHVPIGGYKTRYYT